MELTTLETSTLWSIVITVEHENTFTDQEKELARKLRDFLENVSQVTITPSEETTFRHLYL